MTVELKTVQSHDVAPSLCCTVISIDSPHMRSDGAGKSILPLGCQSDWLGSQSRSWNDLFLISSHITCPKRHTFKRFSSQLGHGQIESSNWLFSIRKPIWGLFMCHCPKTLMSPIFLDLRYLNWNFSFLGVLPICNIPRLGKMEQVQSKIWF